MRCVLLIVYFLTGSLSAYINQLDQPFNFRCPGKQFLYHIFSEHDNGAEDRQFSLECKDPPVDSSAAKCYELQGWSNAFDQPLAFACPLNNYIHGMASEHNNGAEDRRFRFHCCEIPSTLHVQTKCDKRHLTADTTIITADVSERSTSELQVNCKFRNVSYYVHLYDCAYSGFVNNYDRTEEFKVPDGKVLRGVISVHNNGAEDRIFDFEYCSMAAFESDISIG